MLLGIFILLGEMGERVWQLLVIVFILVSITAGQNTDSAVLLALKNGWNNIPSSWDEGSDPCGGDWEGIKCSNSRVTSIVLSSMGLTGDLPGDIGQLNELQILDLSYNKGLTGQLTPAIGNLLNLTKLMLFGCNFTGPIPDTIGNLQKLSILVLNMNRFTGSIPASIGNLSNLYWLDLTTNMLTGEIPVSDLTTPGLDMLTQTRHFHLGYNRLSGDIPPRLFNSNMNLLHLVLQNNQLMGSIPSTLSLVKSLEAVFLSNNKLTGHVPDLTGMNSLITMDLSNNTFDEQDFPSSFSTLKSLATLKMHNTNIGGELPAELFSIPSLQIVDLSSNRLDGTLNISSNPSKDLQFVDLQSNQIAEFPQRREYNIILILHDNPICMESAVATDKYCSLPVNSTTELYSTPQNNCGPISCGSGQVLSPNCQCAYPYTGTLVFLTLPSFSSLENTSMYHDFQDSLMKVFKEVQVPVDSVRLNLSRTNLDHNLLIKLEIFPSGEPRFNWTQTVELGLMLRNEMFNPTKLFDAYFVPDNYTKFWTGSGGPQNNGSNMGLIIGLVAGGCVLVVLLVLAGMHTFHQKRQAERATQESGPFALWDSTSGSGGVPQLKGPRSFTFEELKKYTNNFSEINKIGAGGYGMVYKGSLPNGQLIAIKRAQQASMQGRLEFKTEIELLSRVHHKNVVELIGFCFDQGEHMLVYEYIVNGTLKDSLLGRSGIRLDWTRRLKIALGAARGLQYLHDLADPPIIHRDVKTNNILLDARLVAKVADFGLSKPLSDENRTHVTTQVKGTMGYMDPEYYMTQQLTDKSDVYSFGVVMLELITARNPIEKGNYIVKEIKETMNKSIQLYNLHELLDPTIGLSSQLKGLERFVDLSLRCVEETGNKRPPMSEVVKELESIMQSVGLNPSIESSSSTSTSYEGIGIDYIHPYSNDSLFAYSGGFLPPKLHPK